MLLLVEVSIPARTCIGARACAHGARKLSIPLVTYIDLIHMLLVVEVSIPLVTYIDQIHMLYAKASNMVLDACTCC